jgi:hypothetical protein
MPPPARASAARVQAGGPTWEEYFIYSADFVGAAALAAGVANADPAGTALSYQDFPIKIDSDSDFKWLKSTYVFTDPRVYFRIQDDTSGRRLHRSTLDARAVVGTSFATGMPTETTAFLPFLEPDPYVIAAASTLTITAADFAGLLNTVRFSLHGTKLRPGWAPWERDADGNPRQWRVRLPFKLVLPPDGMTGSIAANQTAIFNAPIDIEADYIVRRVTAIHTGSALVMVQDGSARDRRWMDRPVDIGLFAGNGLFPNYLPAPRWVYRGSSIAATVTETSGLTNRVRFYISGDKLYEA